MATYRKVRDVYQILIDSVQPGARVHDLYQRVQREYENRNLRYESLLVGHSVGPWFHQQEPILRRDSPVILEEGMVLALEPYYQSFHIQDLVVVTSQGCELLTPNFETAEMYNIDI
jgi:Xaa-Pro aminopeptidase